MKETYYFSHDYNSRNDEKIIKLVSKYGWEGYGIFWAIVEKLYEAGGFLDKDYECIAFDLRTDCERIKNVIESGLFEFSNEKFYSKSCLARLKVRKGKSEKARQSAIMRWNKPKSDNANALRTQSEGNAIKERKGKETKGKEISSELSSQVQKIMEIFYRINPTLNWGNKTSRKSAADLIKQFGFEGTAKMAEQAISIQGQPYAPTATTPTQLKERLAQFKIYFDKQKNNSPEILKI